MFKWILGEEALSYSHETYLAKCHEAKILPLEYRFNVADITLFHKVVYKDIPLVMPSYLNPYNNNSRLRSTHLDSLSFVSSISSTSNSFQNLRKSYFIRSHIAWNYLPFELRNTQNSCKFKVELEKYYWQTVLSELRESHGEQYDYLFDDGG